MNIALSAVIIIVLLLPPIAFYVSFVFGKFQRAAPKLGPLEGIMLCAVFALILHTTGITFIKSEIRFDILVLLIGGDFKTTGSLISNTEFRKYVQQFALYNGLLVSISVFLGRFLRWSLYKSRLHVKSEASRLYNHWWYLFRGFKINGHITQHNTRFFDMIFIDALVNTNAGTMLFSGYLSDFVCHGEVLDRIYLAEARKREYKRIDITEKGNILTNEPGPPKLIAGDILSIPYTEIINMNLHFLDLSLENTVIEAPDNASGDNYAIILNFSPSSP